MKYIDSRSKIPLKRKSPSPSPSSGITNLRWPEDDTAWGRNGWKEKPFTVSAQQTEQKKAIFIYEKWKISTQNRLPTSWSVVTNSI